MLWEKQKFTLKPKSEKSYKYRLEKSGRSSDMFLNLSSVDRDYRDNFLFHTITTMLEFLNIKKK